MKKILLSVALLLLTLAGFAQKDSLFRADPLQAYELCNIGTGRSPGGPIADLQDGDTGHQAQIGYGKVIKGTRNDDLWLNLYTYTKSGLQIDSVKLFWRGGPGQPWTLSAWNKGKETRIASFAGSANSNNWVTYKVSTLAQKLHINTDNSIWPTEWKIYGKWINKKVPSHPLALRYLNNQFNVNAFTWSVLQSTNPDVIVKNFFTTYAAFNGLRLYLDWNSLEDTQGVETFNPIHSGGWNLDVITDSLKAHGMTLLVDIKTMPAWMQKTWPNGGDNEYVPVFYGKDFMQPSSYKEQARNAFQFASRYGSTRVPLNLLTINTTTRWTGDPANTAKTGLGSVKYLECDNERDKWWKGISGYQDGLMYAANLSAFYDGDMGKLGLGVGVKTADPNMQVVWGGTCNPTVDNFQAAMDWCRDHRGGTLCWDIFNVHFYCGKVQPEGTLDAQLEPLVRVARQCNKPLWLTETGYDLQAGSSNAAPAIGIKNAAMVQADWVLRSALVAAKIGIQQTFFYEAYDDVPNNATQYATAGLLSTAMSTGRKPAADYMYQVKKLMTGYNFRGSQLINGVEVDTYGNGTGHNRIYAIWLPSSTGATTNITFKNGTLYKPVAGATSMSVQPVIKKIFTVSETPEFLLMSN